MMNRGNVGRCGPVQYINRLDVTLHVPRLVLVPSAECPCNRIEDYQDTLETAFLFAGLDSRGQQVGVNQAGGQVQLATDNDEWKTRQTVMFRPSIDATFGKRLSFRCKENYETLLHLSAVPIFT